MDILFYNTLGRKKEKFKPLRKGVVALYSCGPTVYWYPHIGNMRTYVFVDILRRVLEYNKYKVKHVMNVTDVGHLAHDSDDGEDRVESAAIKEGKTAKEIANFYFKAFKDDMQKLNILTPTVWCKATEHIKEQIDLIKKLEKKGYAYETNDGIYFNSAKFKNYGKMALLNLEDLKAGARIEVGEKKNKTDFALWKFSTQKGKRQQEWKSPWGVGFPGWHIECSAMSMKYLGETFDIHTGGEDHVPLHHTNEIAQSEAATGKKFVNYWLHGAFLTFKGEKVSKSKGGLYTISELEDQGYNALHFRYLCLLTHYRKPLDFSLEHLDAARNAFDRLKRKVVELRDNKDKLGNKKELDEYRKNFLSAVDDDLNLPLGLQVMWKVLDDDLLGARDKIILLEEFDNVFGLGISDMRISSKVVPANVKKLIKERDAARAMKDWLLADKIRALIKSEGFEIEDTPNGAKIV